MNIHAVSDLHLGKQKWQGRGKKDLNSLMSIEDIDILYCGGDVGQTFLDFQEAVLLLSKIKAKHKLWVCGNHDLYMAKCSLLSYEQEIQDLIEEAGFKLLDLSPVVINRTAFVGNIGWYDGSLWKPSQRVDDRYPNTYQDTAVRAEKAFSSAEDYGLIPKGYTNLQFFNLVQSRLREHLDFVSKDSSIDKIVLGTHFVPHEDFLLYENTSSFDYENWFMGFDGRDLYKNYSKIVQGLTGHTHRHHTVYMSGVPVQNISGWNQPTIVSIP